MSPEFGRSQSRESHPKGWVGLGTQVDGPAGTDGTQPGLGTQPGERCTCTHPDDHTERNGCERHSCTCTWWPSIEDWVAERKAERQGQREHRLLVGAALREELARARAAGKRIRHADRLRRQAAQQREGQ